MRLRILIICAIAAGLPVVAQGQYGMSASVRGPRNLSLSDGEPISFFLELSRELDLTDAQRTGLIDIRRRLRIENAPLVKSLDSLARVSGVELGDKPRLTSEDLRALEKFRTISAPVTDAIRVNNEAARAEARVLLADTQRVKMDSITTAVRGRGRRGEPDSVRRQP